MSSPELIRIGTRAAPMALAQAEQVAELIRKHSPDTRTEIVPRKTEADLWQGELARLGGKGLFTKEIDQMLQRGSIDIAVHCMKDVPGDKPIPEGLIFAAYLPREDVRDVVLFPEGSEHSTLDDLPPGATVATSAVRRKAQILRDRPHLQVERVRGLVGNRVEKLDQGKHGWSAMVLSLAGLYRLGLEHRAEQFLSVDEMIPAVGAGVIGIECRRDDAPVAGLLEQLNHTKTMTELTAERVLLHGLRGHCNSPIAGHCITGPDGQLVLRGMVFTREGAQFVHAQHWGEASNDPATLGARVCADLLRQGARELIEGIPH
ncbi:hydroxymethylbilane synthase [Streptomyces sp. AV19]|uniref:hydroxymethylbilane synthase n=1 Tax=Streptomyces sp. AV19 TaxID=2793068 RepID=UPI0018FE9300|nr:hydroxymethylbilane synthase [Streptomyces sp. AV19]MBH1936901.1 hydroxymethylbilane synthase [Streptomyces sp. AV19]MDG4532942.1 hydroxymethylbilane synthase [Streptomyces sp. AV19]